MFSRMYFYLTYAVRSLRRDMMRTFLAGLCVTFGVLSLVAMQLLVNTLLQGSLFDMHLQYGGDALVHSADYETFSTEELAQVEQWHDEGLIAAYTPVAQNYTRFLRKPDNGRVTFVTTFGIDPTSYPLHGQLTLRTPANHSIADLLTAPNSALLTRDLADALQVHVGDSFMLNGEYAAPIRLTITGIIGATPAQTGKAVYYTLQTERLLQNRDDVISQIPVLWGSVPNAAQTVIDSPLQVLIAVDNPGSAEVDLFGVMLRGAGVLGLLVGGIGISNTLQVVLARRKLEIAMLKTMGYKRGDLLYMVGLETSLIGFAGGLIGSLLGALLAGKLLDILSSNGALMLSWWPDPIVVGGGVVLGTFIAAAFGGLAIADSSGVRPIELLRELPSKRSTSRLIAYSRLYIVMVLLLGILVGVIFGSLLQGVLIVVGGLLLLVILRGVFWVLLWTVLKLPMSLPMLKLARNNLRQRKLQASFIVLALFSGAFSVTFAATVIYNAQERVSSARASDEGYNLLVYTILQDAVIAEQKLNEQGVGDIYSRYLVNGTLDGQALPIDGRGGTDWQIDIELVSGEWGAALMPEIWQGTYQSGDTVTLDVNGESYEFVVSGFYRPRLSSEETIIRQPTGIIVPQERAVEIGGLRTQVQIIGKISLSALNTATDTLGQSLPDALVFSKADVNDMITSSFRSLFFFAISIAGLAFVAGGVLIANATGLTVIERRRDIGIFKAVGYTASHVMRLLLSEYVLLSLLAGFMGIVGVVVAVTLINVAQPSAQIVIQPFILAVMILLCVVIAVLSAMFVAWQPTQVRPLDVLRYE